jgi:AFG3 family protein
VEKVAKLLLEKEVITRYALHPCLNFLFRLHEYPFSEDMISLLGKRPFKGKSDDMDKWLDDNQGLGERSAPPPLEEIPGPTPGDDTPAPAPVAVASRIEDFPRL